jgi:hypothetical protein
MQGLDNTTLALPDSIQHTQLNIYDLYRGIQNKKLKRNATYNAVLHKCHAYIKRAAESELFNILFVVPEFLIGVPLFDINHCTAYVINQLRSNGFVVSYYYPRTLYISWDIHEVRKEKESAAAAASSSSSSSSASASASASAKHSNKDDLKPIDPVPEIVQPMYMPPAWDTRPSISPMNYNDVIAPPQTANLNSTLGRPPFSQYMSKFKPNGKFVLNLR